MRLLLVILPLLALSAWAEPDPRYCGEPARYADGTIKRSRAAVAEFRANHPCPVTGLTTGPCEGWQVDHVIPLACGGCDNQANMQWLPASIKTAAGTEAKDRWERKIYGSPTPISGTSCTYPQAEND